MTFDRRRFLAAGAGLGASAAWTGCGVRLPLPRAEPGLERPGPWPVPNSTKVDLPTHVLRRLTWGPRPQDRGRLLDLAPRPEEAVDRWIERQLAPGTIDDGETERRIADLEYASFSAGDLFELHPERLHEDRSRSLFLRAISSERQLQEVLVGFWGDHFNVDRSKGDGKWTGPALDRELRKRALGPFADLLQVVTSSPAMLWSLDGRENRIRGPGDQPNENHARELLELHTLGIEGGYTQRDVLEVARCLSGWTVRGDDRFLGRGRVEFEPADHDDGPKQLLGHHLPAGLGKEDLDRLLEILVDHPSTALHVARKLVRRFVADEPPEAATHSVAATFRRTRGDIEACLRDLFASEEFRSSRDCRWKRPFRFVVSALRATGAESDGGEELDRVLLSLGHAPFSWPTPDGPPDAAESWMGGLFWRWRFAADLAFGQLDGTRLDPAHLARLLGGPSAVAAHLLGRRPSVRAARPGRRALALLLASPEFQRY